MWSGWGVGEWGVWLPVNSSAAPKSQAGVRASRRKQHHLTQSPEEEKGGKTGSGTATKAARAKKYLPSSAKGGRWRPFKQH